MALSSLPDFPSLPLEERVGPIRDLARSIGRLGAAILESRAIDTVLGSPQAASTGKILDSSWLFFALHTVAVELCWEKQKISTADLGDEISLPRSAADIPQWCFRQSNTLLKRLAADEDVLSRPGTWAFVKSNEGAESTFLLRTRKVLRRLAFHAQKRLFRRSLRAVTLNLYNLEENHLVLGPKSRAIGLLPLDSMLDLAPVSQPDLKLRQRLAALFSAALQAAPDPLWSEAHCQLIARYLSLAIPGSHLEARVENLARAERLVAPMPARHILQLTGLYYDSAAVFAIAAHKKLHRSHLIGCQHGGCYGYVVSHAYALQVEGSICDSFLSWGWESWSADVDRARCKVVATGSFYLRGLKAGYKGATKPQPKCRAILYGGSMYGLRMIRLESPFYTAGDFRISAWSDAARSVTNLAKAYDLGVHYKPYPTDYNEYNDILSAQSKSAGVEFTIIDPALRMIDLVSGYPIVLWDNASTGFCECLAMGVPTLLTPLARVVLVLFDDIGLSDAFFIDRRVDEFATLEERFATALAESSGFVERYAKPARMSLNDWVVANLPTTS